MPFGSGDRETLGRIAMQLQGVAEDLAALKQQVADQQHAIDQMRQDATTAITTGLAEIRAVARDALARTSETSTSHLANIGSELVAIRGTISGLDQQIKTQAAAVQSPAPEPAPAPAEAPRPEPEQEVEPEPTPGLDPAAEPDPDILQAAAGIAHATVEAHRDTWAILVQIAGNEQHFHIPGRVEDHDGFVSVRFSGPSLVAAITSLDRVRRTAPSPVTRAIAAHIHGKITTAVQEIIDYPHRGDGDGTPVRIVIDDRPARPQPDEQ